MVRLGAIAGVFCASILPGAMLHAGASFGAYNARALALLAVGAGYGGCSVFGNLARLVADMLRSGAATPLDASTLRDAFEAPLRETVGDSVRDSFNKQFAPEPLPQYEATLSANLTHNGVPVTARSAESTFISLHYSQRYDLLVRIVPGVVRIVPGSTPAGDGVPMVNSTGRQVAEVTFDLEIDADGLTASPDRQQLVVRKGEPASTLSVALTAPESPLLEGGVTGEADVERHIRVLAYCGGIAAGRVVIPFKLYASGLR
jgi:hypothetical protein